MTSFFLLFSGTYNIVDTCAMDIYAMVHPSTLYIPYNICANC